MIWLTWRQSRLELLVGGIALALVIVFVLWTRLQMGAYFDDVGLPSCVARSAVDEECVYAGEGFLGRFRYLQFWTSWLNFFPLLLGLLLAAPTVLDLEHGTYRLAWTQSVTRRRWLAAKIGFGLAIAVGVAAALVPLWTWWRGPIDAIEGPLNGDGFDFEGTVPIAYAVFAYALCLALGTTLRRSIPSIGIAFIVFLAARLSVIAQLRPRYLAPVELTWLPTDPMPRVAQSNFFRDGIWYLHEGMIDAAGNEVTRNDAVVRDCMATTVSKAGDLFDACLQDRGILYTIVYHPADRFWVFQAMETALFLGVAAGLLALTYWWVTRRVA